MMNISKRLVAALTVVCVSLTSWAGVAQASMIGTATAIDMDQRAQYVSDIKGWLTKDKVREQLVSMGVDPADASKRVASMTGEELRTLHQKIEDLPAGAGLVGLIGVVFVVLIILELVGITHVFTRF